MASPRFPTLESSLQSRARGEGGRLEVERVREVLEARDVGVHTDVGDAGLDSVHFREPGEKSLFVANHTRVLGHGVTDRALQRAHVLFTVGGEERVDLAGCLGERGGGAALGWQRAGILGGGLADNTTEDQQLDQGVATESIRSVQPTRGLADRVEPVDVGAVVFGANPHPAHRVVRGGRDLDRVRRNVEHLQLEHRLVNAGEATHNRLARQVRDVEPHTTVGGAATLLDLGVTGEGDPVAGGEFHPLGVVLAHKALAESVPQDATLAARGLADQRAGRTLGLDDAARVELHKLRVSQAPARFDGETERVTGVLITTGGGATPDAVVTTGGEDYGIRMNDITSAVVDVEAIGPEYHVVVDEDAGDVDGVENIDVQLRGPVDEGALDLETGVVAGKRRAAELVGAEEPLGDAAVVLAGKRHPVSLEVFDAACCTRGDNLHGVRVGQQVALFEGVGGVLLPGVFLVHRGEGRVDSTGGERGVGIRFVAFTDRENVDPLLREFDGRPQARTPGSNHKYGRRDLTGGR